MIVVTQSSRHNMWTEITRRKYDREGQRYASDLTDQEWALIEPHMPAVKRLGRPRETELRSVLDAILYIARTGCQWRMLPKDFPTFTTVQGYFYDWRDDGMFEKINFELLLQAREAGRARTQPVGGGSSTANRSRPLRVAVHAAMMLARRSKAASAVCHEHIDRSRRCGAAQEMRVGPLRSVIRCRPQNRCKLRPSRATVVSVAEKSERDFGRWDPKRRAKANRR